MSQSSSDARCFRLSLALSLGAWLGLAGCTHGTGADDKNEDSAVSMIRLGNHMRANRDLASATAFYRRAVNMAGDDLPTLLLAAETLEEIEANDEAIEVYRQALNRSPDNNHVQALLGRLLLVDGRTEEAVSFLEKALRGGDDDVSALLNLGTAYTFMGEPSKAALAYRKGLAIDPDNLDMKSNLALSLALVDDLDSALALAADVETTNDVTLQHLRNVALVYALADRPPSQTIRKSLLDDEVRRLQRRATWLGGITPPANRARALGAVFQS